LDESVHIAQNLLNDFVPGGDSPLDLAFQITQQQEGEEGVVKCWIPNVSAAEQAGAKVCPDDFAQLLACHCNAQQLPRGQILGHEILKQRVLSLETKETRQNTLVARTHCSPLCMELWIWPVQKAGIARGLTFPPLSVLPAALKFIRLFELRSLSLFGPELLRSNPKQSSCARR
jgi:hypothetical protein